MFYHPLAGNPLIAVGNHHRDPGDPRNYNGQYNLLLWAFAGDWAVTATKITQWNDRSGKANNLTQAVDANRFVVDATGFGGFAAASSPGGTVGMSTPSVTLGVHTVLFAMAGANLAAAGFVWSHTADSENSMQNTITPSSQIKRAAGTSRKEATSTWLRDGVRKTAGRTFDGTHAGHLLYVNGLDIGAASGVFTADPGLATVSDPIFFGNRTGTTGAAGLYREIMVFGTAVPPQLMAILDRGIKSRCPGAIV